MSTSMKKMIAQAKKVAHPNSRKSIAISKKAKKLSNREKQKLGSAVKQNLVGEKMLWIQENMVPDVCPYTPELTAELLQKYMARYDEELEQIAIKRSIGPNRRKQHASREDVLNMTKEREKLEYDTCGIEIPDILNPTHCEMLRKWDGELRYMTNFKFIRFGKKNLLQPTKNQTKGRERTKTKSISKHTDAVTDDISESKKDVTHSMDTE